MATPAELLTDVLAVAGEELGVPVERLLQTVPLAALEEAGDDLDSVEEAAFFGGWIIRHKPFPRRNRQIGYRCMRLMLKQAEVPWPRPREDRERIEAMIRRLEAGLISEAKFVDWVRLRVATA
jgi:hypothetical protein